MKVFVPFEETLVDELLAVGEALVPFKIECQRGRVSWDRVELLEDTPPPTQSVSRTPLTVE